jgi:hypothetical protein
MSLGGSRLRENETFLLAGTLASLGAVSTDLIEDSLFTGTAPLERSKDGPAGSSLNARPPATLTFTEMNSFDRIDSGDWFPLSLLSAEPAELDLETLGLRRVADWLPPADDDPDGDCDPTSLSSEHADTAELILERLCRLAAPFFTEYARPAAVSCSDGDDAGLACIKMLFNKENKADREHRPEKISIMQSCPTGMFMPKVFLLGVFCSASFFMR